MKKQLLYNCFIFFACNGSEHITKQHLTMIQPVYSNKTFKNNMYEKPHEYITHELSANIQLKKVELARKQGKLPPYLSPELKKFLSKNTNSGPITTSPYVQWLGHATFIIKINNKTIITDPIFWDIEFRIDKSKIPLYKRLLPCGVNPKKLPRIDYVLLSHKHPDHMDERSLQYIAQKSPHATVITPYGAKKECLSYGFKKIIETTWGDQITINNITFTCIPAHHWSNRSFHDVNTSLWSGWMIQDKTLTIYFAGDTAFDKKQTTDIKRFFNRIDLALVPIAPCNCHNNHVDPKEALQIIDILSPKKFIPMHWGTFEFDLIGAQRIISELKKEWRKKKRLTQLHLLGSGQSLKIN